MQLTYDPWMIRDRSFTEICRFAAEFGYEAIELSPRDDFLPLFNRPNAEPGRIAELKKALADHGLELASMWTVYRWAQPNDSDACDAAVRYTKRFVELAVELGCQHISSEFSGQPDAPQQSEAAFFRSMEQVVPMLEKAGVTMALDPHPGDWVEDGYVAMEVIRQIASAHLKFLYSAPHTFFMDQKNDMAALLRHVSPDLSFVRVADTFDHRQPVRYIVNPIGSPVVVHQHLNIGEGELDWDTFFTTLKQIGYDGPVSNSVFAWPDRAEHSAQVMYEKMTDYLGK